MEQTTNDSAGADPVTTRTLGTTTAVSTRAARTRTRRYRAAGLGALGVTALLLSGCAGGSSAASGIASASSSADAASASSSDEHGGHGMSGTSASRSGDATAASDRNDADVMFAQMMLPHHQQAVELSDVMLGKSGVDPRITSLAQQIKAAQGPEITTMQGWLQEWGAPATMPAGQAHSMDGMVAEADVQALRDADGARADDLFLSQMIGHHEGAVAMAEDELADGRNAQATHLAQQVIDSQTAEIATMKSLQR